MSYFLEARGLRKTFDGTTVLEDIDFRLERGECLVLLGPSGCGKTTLLNIIAGMLATDAGELHCDGDLLDAPARGLHQPMRERRFSMVFQDFSLWPHMSVADNVAFGLKVQGMARAERRRRVAEVLRQVQMEAFADRSPGNLSGGQQQRVSIARALAVRPRLLLLDEPLSALDARLREDLKVELGTLLRDTGVTAIYVTHDQSEAFSLASRIALMYQGRIEQIGAPEEIYRAPASAFAAGFLGVSNLMPYRRHNGGLRLGERTDIHWRLNGVPDEGQLMVRRESVWVSPSEAPANGCIALAGVCHRTNFLGDRHEAVVSVGEDGFTLRGFSDERVPEGTPVQVRFPAEAVHFLQR